MAGLSASGCLLVGAGDSNCKVRFDSGDRVGRFVIYVVVVLLNSLFSSFIIFITGAIEINCYRNLTLSCKASDHREFKGVLLFGDWLRSSDG